MAPTTPQGSGARSRARRRRRRHSPARYPTPAPPSVDEPEPALASLRAKRKRMGLAKERPRKRVVERIDEEVAAAGASASAATEQDGSSEASSAVSSPIRRPYIPRAVIGHDSCGGEILEPAIHMDPALFDAYGELKDKLIEKIKRQQKLITLNPYTPRSCMVDPELLCVRESATKTVLKTAKIVVGLSSYLDGNLLGRSSGFMIEWDKESRIGTVLTSGSLFRLNSVSRNEWLGTDEYSPDAEVRVHLLDKEDSVVVASLLHHNKHYNIALFKIVVDLSHAQIPPFGEVKYCQNVFVLGRDENLHLNVDHGRVQYKGPRNFEHNHHMFIGCGISELYVGGPVTDYNGEVLGMVSRSEMAFMPSNIIMKCLRMWKKFSCIPRLQVGLKFSSIKFLDLAQAELISRKCDIDSGLIVKEVCEGSYAEKKGVRTGDIIECWNGEKVSTTIELENMLLCICEEQLDNGIDMGSNVELQVGIFHTRKDSRSTIKLMANISEDVEVVKEEVLILSCYDDYVSAVSTRRTSGG
ncbi:hypothetical protein ACP4OV_029239 [Aristida adscensionis]